MRRLMQAVVSSGVTVASMAGEVRQTRLVTAWDEFKKGDRWLISGLSSLGLINTPRCNP
ncbi:MAG: hypothetical protein F6K42_25170 [Leptolyngbya sp. SIO1D8]|nr:hypothetical protein [Leptolyngbya sp. SIO1D8]